MIRFTPGGGFFGVADTFAGTVKALHINWWVMRTLGAGQHYCDIGVAYTLPTQERTDGSFLPLILPFEPRPSGQADFSSRLQSLENANLVFGRNDLAVSNQGRRFYKITPDPGRMPQKAQADHNDVLPVVLIPVHPPAKSSGPLLTLTLPAFPREADDDATFYSRIRLLPMQRNVAWQALPFFWLRAMLDLRVNDPRESIRVDDPRPVGLPIPRVDAFAIVPWSYGVSAFESHAGGYHARKLEAENWRAYSGRTSLGNGTPSVVYHWSAEECDDAEPLRALLQISRPSDRRLVVPLLAAVLIMLILNATVGEQWLKVAFEAFQPAISWLARVLRAAALLVLGVFGVGVFGTVVAMLSKTLRERLLAAFREGRIRRMPDNLLGRLPRGR